MILNCANISESNPDHLSGQIEFHLGLSIFTLVEIVAQIVYQLNGFDDPDDSIIIPIKNELFRKNRTNNSGPGLLNRHLEKRYPEKKIAARKEANIFYFTLNIHEPSLNHFCSSAVSMPDICSVDI